MLIRHRTLSATDLPPAIDGFAGSALGRRTDRLVRPLWPGPIRWKPSI